MKRQRYIIECALVGVLGVAVLGATLALSRKSDALAFFDPLIDVRHLIESRFVREFDDLAMQHGAIRGMIETLGDPHTAFVPGELRRDFEKDLTGEYVGIGAQITMREGWLTIVSPLEDSPAYRAGVRADDRVVEIEGESTFGLTSEECVRLLAGEPGTYVSIVVERAGSRIGIDIRRDHVKTRSVKGLARDPDDPQAWRYLLDERRRIGYLRITQFTPQCGVEVVDALLAMGADRDRLNGLVIDLRWNPGGVLEEAVRIADLFLTEGVIVSTRGRRFPEVVQRATPPVLNTDAPIVVLINATSASASEILAGALVENDRAIALGTRTFGKGSVQSVITLPSAADGSQLKITEQLYYLPSGRSIHRMDDSAQWGVDPSPGFYVPISSEDETAIFRLRHELEIIRAPQAEDPVMRFDDPSFLRNHLRDEQLAAALTTLQARVDTGKWLRTGQEGADGAVIAAAELERIRLTRERMIREIQRMDRRIEALDAVAADAPRSASFDLWPDDVSVVGGRIEIFDADGRSVARLRITGDRLERWLMDADVEPILGDESP